MANGEAIEVTLLVTEVLENLGIPYLVGGSIASSLHGFPRATQDVDLVADLLMEHIEPLVEILGQEFYIDGRMIGEAIAQKSSFNIIHLATMFKVDVFVYKSDRLSLQEMERRERYVVDENSQTQLFLASAEDIILQKLYWFNLGDRISDRQWNDLIGVLKVRSSDLDFDYMEEVAAQTGLTQLLAEARSSI